jgi:hypothetical protein
MKSRILVPYLMKGMMLTFAVQRDALLISMPTWLVSISEKRRCNYTENVAHQIMQKQSVDITTEDTVAVSHSELLTSCGQYTRSVLKRRT